MSTWNSTKIQWKTLYGVIESVQVIRAGDAVTKVTEILMNATCYSTEMQERHVMV